MTRRTSCCLAAGIAFALVSSAAAAPSRHMTAAELGAAIERRADTASFADLRRFGDAAASMPGREGLRRLNYVATVFQSQSEFDLFQRYNDALARAAAAQQDARFAAIADLNRLGARYERGDVSVAEAFRTVARTAGDWYVRVDAEAYWAGVLMDRHQTGEALKTLAEAELLIPKHDPDARDAEANVWETIGLALEGLDDLEGAARAFERSQIEFANPAYPRPDFDTVYNLAHMAIDLGDRPSAEKLVSAHHRLTLRSDLPHLAAWDANLCGMYAEAFGTPAQVLDCLKGLGADLEGEEFLTFRVLPMRAIAEARTGKLAEARADLERLKGLERKGAFGAQALARIPLVEAELLRAEGRPADAYDLLRDFERRSRFGRAQEVYGGVRQITGSLESQLQNARHDMELERQAMRAERLVIALALLLCLGVAAILVLQVRGARRLKAARRRAEAANEAKSTFLATMSHEIRTPMNGVLGMAQAMQADELTPLQRERLAVIRQSGEALLAILNDVLDLSKIEAGKLELEAMAFDLEEMVGAVHAAFAPLAEQKGLGFSLEVEPSARGRYLGDPNRVRQILFNLVSNAIKFTERGGVRMSARRSGETLEMSVADTGIGIGPEHRSKLFEKFDQLESSTSRRFGGTGLGLAISRELALLMGGDIGVETELGRGSRFTLSAPLPWLGAREGPRQEAIGAGAAGALPHVASLRVLAVDDNAVNQLVLKTLLEQLGVEPAVVGSGREALDAWAREAWDLVLMDIQMPGMDGVEVTRRIREDEARLGRPRTPIVALTANAMEHQVAEYLAAGMDGHMAKPIQIPELVAALERALATSSAKGSAAAARVA